MTLIPISTSISALIQVFLWQQRSKTGVEPVMLHWLSWLAVGICRGIFFFVLMLIAKGWSITRAHLK